MKKILIILFLLLFIIGCKQQEKETKEVTQIGNLKLTSPAFQNNQHIPDEYTCNGPNINPELHIEGIPEKTKTLALVVNDPDAPSGSWIHWLLFNIPLSTTKIAKNSVPQNAIQGLNDFNKNNYGGPCPPSGTHRYFFKLYALDTTLNLDKTAKAEDLEKAMQGHILEETDLIGLYSQK